MNFHLSDFGWGLAALVIGATNGLGQVFMRLEGKQLRSSELFSVHQLAAHPRWWGGLFLCWGCGLAYAIVVTRLRLNVAVPLFIASMYLAVSLLGVWLLEERLQSREALAFVAIGVGVVLLSWR